MLVQRVGWLVAFALTQWACTPGPSAHTSTGDEKTGSAVQGSPEQSTKKQEHKKPQWDYTETIDPISKKVTLIVKGLWHVMEDKSTLMGFEFSCAKGEFRTAAVEVSTLQVISEEKLEGLAQNPTSEPGYRFDGVAQTLKLEDINRHFSNSVLMQLGTYWAIRYQANGDLILPAVDSGKPDQFYISDSDFVVRIGTTKGNATVEFSLDEPTLTRFFRDCGFIYGKPPEEKKKRHRAEEGSSP
jgi:hypothetical protein